MLSHSYSPETLTVTSVLNSSAHVLEQLVKTKRSVVKTFVSYCVKI